MKYKMSFFFVFITVQLFLIFFQIYKSSTMMKYSYQKQRNEKIAADLIERKKELQHILEKLKSKSTIKANGLKAGMVPIRLSKVKRLNEDNANTL